MEPILPKLTAKVLQSESLETKPKHRSKKPVKKRDIGWPTDFRHSSHIGFEGREGKISVEVVPIEVDGKIVYVDANTMDKLQDVNLSSPVLEGKEWAVDVPPSSVSPSRRPKPKRTPVLAETSEQVFAQPVTSVDTPTIIPSQYENIPMSTKRMPAPPPPATKKPALKPMPSDTDSTDSDVREATQMIEDSSRIAQIEEEIIHLSEKLLNLRKEKERLMAVVEEKERERSLLKTEKEYEPFIQAQVIDENVSFTTNRQSTSASEPEDVPPSPKTVSEVVQKVAKHPAESKNGFVKTHVLVREKEIEKDDSTEIKDFFKTVTEKAAKPSLRPITMPTPQSPTVASKPIFPPITSKPPSPSSKSASPVPAPRSPILPPKSQPIVSKPTSPTTASKPIPKPRKKLPQTPTPETVRKLAPEKSKDFSDNEVLHF